MKEQYAKKLHQAPPAEIRDGHALLDLARSWLKQGNAVVAIELLNSALASPEAIEQPELQAQVFKEIGRAWMMQSDWDNALSHYVSAQHVFLELDNLRGAAECARNRANVCFQRGLYQEAEDLCNDALTWCGKIGDHELRATVLNTLGAIKSETGDQEEAIKTFGLCLADFRATGNVIRQGYVLLNIGLCQTELHNYDAAIQSLHESLVIAFEEHDLHLVEICYQNIAKCHLAQRSTILARAITASARKMLPALNSKALEAELNLIDCEILRTTCEFEKAESLLYETHRMTVEHGLTALEADVLLEQGLLFRSTGWHDRAESCLAAAVRQYRQLGIEKGVHKAVAALNHLTREKAVA